jgi:DNA polymerase-3 subunit chi
MDKNPISAKFMILMHGAEPLEWRGFERVFVVFDGKSDAQVEQARTQWKLWRDLPDREISYFKQLAGGKWEQTA